MLDEGVIQHGSSPYASPVVLVVSCISKLMAFDFAIEYKKGVENKVVDALSRNPSAELLAISILGPHGSLLDQINISWTIDQHLEAIIGLPKSNGKEVILVVVDRLRNYGNFLALSRPYTTQSVAQYFLDNIFKLHGMPNTLPSDRDSIFLSNFWQELFYLASTIQLLKFHIGRAQQRMRDTANKHRCPYPSFFSCFPIEKVFRGSSSTTYPPVIQLSSPYCPSREAIIDRRHVKTGNRVVEQVLVTWSDLDKTQATWEFEPELQHRFSTFHFLRTRSFFNKEDLESGPITDDATLEPLDDETCSEMQLLQRNNINRIVQEKNWDELHEFGGVTGFAEALDSHLENGIVGDTEDICIRNATIKFPQTFVQVVVMFFYVLFEALKGWTIFLLVVAIILSLAFEIDEEGIQKCWLDNLILLMSVLGLIMFKLVGIYWEDKKLMKKMKDQKRKMQRQRAAEEVRVIRGGIEGLVRYSDLVYGDIIFLRRGDLVPANGIFVSNCGEALEVRDDDDVELCINDQNPFLLLGSEVIKGDAKMIVTSSFVGNEADQWTERMRRAITKSTSHTGFNLDACFEKLRTKIHVIGIAISILTLVVMFMRFKFHQDDEHENRLEIKEEPAKFSRIVNSIRKFARDAKLTTLFCVSLVGIREGLSLVVSGAIFYWKRKIVRSYHDYSKIDTSLLLKVESSVTIVCSMKNGWLIEQNHQAVIRDIAVKTLAELGNLKTIFISEDDVDELKNIVSEVGFNSDDDTLVVNGEDFYQLSDADKMEKIDKTIYIMGNCSVRHKLLLVKCLKLKGKVVLMLGERTSDGLVIQKADFGMYINTWSFDYLIVMIMGNAPLTTLKLIWLSFLVTFTGGLALFSGQREDERLSVDKHTLKMKAMWRNIIVQVTYQIVIFVVLQCKGKANNIHSEFIIFNGFALCQFFSILCAREPEKKNIFYGCRCNYWFWAACGIFLILHVGIVEGATLVISDNMQVEWTLWAVCFSIGVATCFFDWAGKCTLQYIAPIAQYFAFASMCTLQPLVSE
ncbi:hypothetical protein CQW23_12154 [Capsicum baccatum]|uniref:Integrase catalytic domain-containing protein n=1 Tax=Capsicum baccatum TaxID=33114 RepID=A0A2G2WRR8_CAPBA|nr:hypothetical protein CQW23_12154 [Capsicum baccatum]